MKRNISQVLVYPEESLHNTSRKGASKAVSMGAEAYTQRSQAG